MVVASFDRKVVMTSYPEVRTEVIMKHTGKTRLTAYWAMVVLSVCAGCGAATSRETSAETELPPVDEDLLNLIPEAPNAVIWIELEALRASALWNIIETLFGSTEGGLIKEAHAFNPLLKADEILLAFSAGPKGESDQILTVIKKRQGNVGELMKSLIGEEKSTPAKIGPFNGFRTNNAVVVMLTDRTLAAGSEPLVIKAAELARNSGRSLKSDPEFADFALGDSTVQLRYKRGVSIPDFSKYGAPPPSVSVDAVRGIDAEMKIKEGLKININVLSETQMDASGLTRELKKTRRKLGKNMFLVFLGVDWLLERIKIKTNETKVSVSMKLDARDLAELNRLAERLRKIRELSEGSSEDLSNDPLELPSEKVKP
jgi:hypothetical protein